jgi:hypothetical protein
MRPPPAAAKLSDVTRQRIIVDAAVERSVIRGALTAANGERREFHGWLELNTALEAILDLDANPSRNVTTEKEQYPFHLLTPASLPIKE